MAWLKYLFGEIVHLGGLNAKELGRRVWQEIREDKCGARAAQLAYYYLFALFPFFLFLTTLLAYLPVGDLLGPIMEYLEQILPRETFELVRSNVQSLITEERGGLLSFGIVAALWASSTAITAIMDALNEAYGVKERRPFWKVRAIAILLTIGLSFFLILSIILLIFGPLMGSWIAATVHLSGLFEIAWNIVRWPVIFLLMNSAVAVLYYFAPDVEQKWRFVTPGSIFAVTGWITASLAFSYYVDNFGSYNKTYGSIGAIIVLLTWMYLSGLLILLGGEINSEIENAARDGKSAGDKTF